MKLPMGRFGSLRPARARRMASDSATMAASWPMIALVQRLLHVQELLGLVLQHARHRDAGDRADQRGDVLGRDDQCRGASLPSHSAFLSS